MKCIKSLIVDILLILSFGFYISANADESDKYKISNETTFVSMQAGEGPGQYFRFVGAGCKLSPRCFAIEPNSGDFFIPDVNLRGKIRLHHYEYNGNFKKTINLEGEVNDSVYNIAVSPSGKFFLMVNVYYGLNAIYCYDQNGKLLSKIGQQGILQKEDYDPNDISPSHLDNKMRTKFFFGKASTFDIIGDNLIVIENRDDDSTHYYEINVNSYNVRHVTDLIPLEMQARNIDAAKKRESLSKKNFQENYKRPISHTLIGPNGQFYYMTVTKQKLEIVHMEFEKVE